MLLGQIVINNILFERNLVGENEIVLLLFIWNSFNKNSPIKIIVSANKLQRRPDYDKIELKQEEKLIYIYKDNKVAIYPKTNMFYDYLEKTSPSFYRFERGGKRGYLDIHTFEEYLDNK